MELYINYIKENWLVTICSTISDSDFYTCSLVKQPSAYPKRGSSLSVSWLVQTKPKTLLWPHEILGTSDENTANPRSEKTNNLDWWNSFSWAVMLMASLTLTTCFPTFSFLIFLSQNAGMKITIVHFRDFGSLLM